MGKAEWLHYTDIKDSDLYPYLSDTFSQKPVSSLVCGADHHTERSGDSQFTIFENSLQSNSPTANDCNFFLLPIKDLKSVSVWNKWRVLSFAGHTDALIVIKQAKRFYFSSVKLIDGFKFIIKIPDKLSMTI
ncbi:hypothetical protein [Chryseobacterium sp.]|uniref:hypothetical protein n=1 Tax=Chryseobacterium sp. TaxID=1871047 RepID=UPI003219E7BD